MSSQRTPTPLPKGVSYGHHLHVAARILYLLRALPFDEAIDVLAIVCRCATDRNIQGRFWEMGAS